MKNINRRKPIINKICPVCNKEFKCNGNKRKYCSRYCKYEGYKARIRQTLIDKKCQYLHCNNIIKSNKRKFCCRQCCAKENYRLSPQKYMAKSLKYVANNINAKIAKNLRIRLVHALRGNYKYGSAIKDLGCSIAEFNIYLENKFKEGMTWENYGSVWHIDHVKPLSKFNLTMREQVLEAVNYTNLQPLFAEENLSKSNNWEQE